MPFPPRRERGVAARSQSHDDGGFGVVAQRMLGRDHFAFLRLMRLVVRLPVVVRRNQRIDSACAQLVQRERRIGEDVLQMELGQARPNSAPDNSLRACAGDDETADAKIILAAHYLDKVKMSFSQSALARGRADDSRVKPMTT